MQAKKIDFAIVICIFILTILVLHLIYFLGTIIGAVGSGISHVVDLIYDSI